MSMLQRLRDRRTIGKLTRHLPARSRKCLAILMGSFTAEELASFRKGDSLLAAPSGEAYLWVVNAVEKLLSTWHYDRVISELSELVPLWNGIRQEYDPEGTRYPASAHEDIITITREFLGTKTPVTRDQKRSLMAVSFLTRLDTENSINSYYPEFSEAQWQNTLSCSITSQIVANPDISPAVYAKTYLERTARREELEVILSDGLYMLDSICDYPDKLIEKFTKLKSENSTHCWGGIKNLIRLDDMTPEKMDDFLSVCEQHFGNYGVPYLYSILDSVDSYPEMQDTGAPNHAQHRQALLHVALALNTLPGDWDQYVTRGRIKDERLIDLVMRDPECSAAVANVITERQHYDYDQVKAALKLGVLGGGAL